MSLSPVPVATNVLSKGFLDNLNLVSQDPELYRPTGITFVLPIFDFEFDIRENPLIQGLKFRRQKNPKLNKISLVL